jgi:hypothetical protein
MTTLLMSETEKIVMGDVLVKEHTKKWRSSIINTHRF